jgi:hypothetical protein
MSTTLPVRLLHIPKTAGTTLASGLLRARGRSHRFVFSADPAESRERFSAMPKVEQDAVRTFIGHSLYHTGIPHADDAQIITVIREPVSRVKSFITHVAEGRSNYISSERKPIEDFSIDDFLASDNNELRNLQVKALINRDWIDSPSGISELGGEAALDQAVDNLFSGVTAFGLQDRFDEGWVAIWKALGVRTPIYATMNRKRGTKKLDFTPEHIERIVELNQLDIRLYQLAQDEFDRRIRHEDAVPPELMEDFRRRQARSGKRFSKLWNRTRSFYYLCRRTKRRIIGK